MFIALSNETFTSSVSRSIYSLIRIWIDSIRNVFLKESLSQQNWRGRLINLLVGFEVWVSFVGKLLLTFSHVTIALRPISISHIT